MAAEYEFCPSRRPNRLWIRQSTWLLMTRELKIWQQHFFYSYRSTCLESACEKAERIRKWSNANFFPFPHSQSGSKFTHREEKKRRVSFVLVCLTDRCSLRIHLWRHSNPFFLLRILVEFMVRNREKLPQDALVCEAEWKRGTMCCALVWGSIRCTKGLEGEWEMVYVFDAKSMRDLHVKYVLIFLFSLSLFFSSSHLTLKAEMEFFIITLVLLPTSMTGNMDLRSHLYECVKNSPWHEASKESAAELGRGEKKEWNEDIQKLPHVLTSYLEEIRSHCAVCFLNHAEGRVVVRHGMRWTQIPCCFTLKRTAFPLSWLQIAPISSFSCYTVWWIHFCVTSQNTENEELRKKHQNAHEKCIRSHTVRELIIAMEGKWLWLW